MLALFLIIGWFASGLIVMLSLCLLLHLEGADFSSMGIEEYVMMGMTFWLGYISVVIALFICLIYFTGLGVMKLCESISDRYDRS